MVAILIRTICNDVEMMRHTQGPNDDKDEEASMNRRGDDDVRAGRPPQQPAEESRDPHSAASPAPASEAEGVAAAMSDITYERAASFERRDEQRSAFSSVQPEAGAERSIVPPGGKQDHHHQQQNDQPEQSQGQQSQAPPAAPMPRPVARSTTQEPLPFESPAPYHPQQHHAEGQQYPYHYQGYPPYGHHQYDYSGYYPPPNQSGSTSPSMSSATQQYPPPYPGYHHRQEYGTYPQEYSNQYSYYPGGQYAPQQPYYPSQTPPSSHSAPGSLKEAPSAVTDSTKGSSSMARRPGTPSGEGLDLSPLDDDRKPSASEQRPIRGILKQDSPPQVRGQHTDFEPIPLDQIAAIPVLSDSAAMHPPTPPSSAYGAASSSGTYPRAYAQHPYARPPPAASAQAQVAPPAPRSTPRRRQPRTLAPSSSGSASSTGGVEGSWERRYQELIEFKSQHGHCEVPQNYAANTSLGTWVNKQRMEHKNRMDGKSSSLNDSRLERLQSVGFRWAKRKGQVSWDEKFNELLEYKARFGNCHVPTKYKDNTALGRWVSTQRAEYKKYQEGQVKTSMNADKIRRLESIGFAWFMAL